MANSRDIVSAIALFNRGRDPERLARKYKAMQKDALGFFRGTCHLFCEDWPQSDALNKTPAVWVCGDLHIENVGTYKGDNRLVYFDIADFDESILAPCAWDLARLATSALIAAKVRGLKRKQARELCDVFLRAYTFALKDGKARWIERATAVGPIGSLLRNLEGRSRAALVGERTEPGSANSKLLIDGKHTLAISDGDRKRVKGFMREFGKECGNPRFFKALDVARRIAGTGSLGLERYTILLAGRGTPAGRFLLDLKAARPSALAPYVKQQQPRWSSEAERIVAIERRMQAVAPALIHPVSIDSTSYVLRELMPTEDKLDLKGWKGSREGLDLLARDLGYLVAWSQLRSGGRDGSAIIDELIAFANERRWRKSVLAYAEKYADTAWRDWKAFRKAYEDKALPIP